MKSVRIKRDTLPDHPWVYRKQVLKADPGTRNGDPVRILTRDGKPAGAGLYNGQSQIALRVLTRDPGTVIDKRFIEKRIDAAIRLRRESLNLDRRTDAYRLVNSEGDGLSGLILDRYGPVVVAQIKCLGFYRFGAEVREILRARMPECHLTFRRDAQAEKIEGFRVPDPDGKLAVEVRSDGVRMKLDLAAGHKTGAFLDQRDNRLLAASVGRGRRVLDLFCYEGSFALACAKAGAKEVQGLDLDEKAVERARANTRLNDCDVRFGHGDAFDVLRAGVHEDFLLLDPPKWISSREEENPGRRRYLDLNRLGIAALDEGGLLMTSSCSGRLSERDFTDILRQAAREAGKSLKILATTGAAPDHPVTADFAEGRYLTTVLAQVGPR